MKTKAQKIKQVETGVKDVAKNATLIVADFTGISVNEMNSLRKTLKAAGATFAVVKKRLLKIVLEKSGITFDTKSLVGQTGVIFSPKDMVETAGMAYQFGKQKKDLFKILVGFEIKEKNMITGMDVLKYGKLPSREVLLGQLAAMLTIPIKKFLFVLDQQSKKTVEAK